MLRLKDVFYWKNCSFGGKGGGDRKTVNLTQIQKDIGLLATYLLLTVAKMVMKCTHFGYKERLKHDFFSFFKKGGDSERHMCEVWDSVAEFFEFFNDSSVNWVVLFQVDID